MFLTMLFKYTNHVFTSLPTLPSLPLTYSPDSQLTKMELRDESKDIITTVSYQMSQKIQKQQRGNLLMSQKDIRATMSMEDESETYSIHSE